MLAVAPVGQPTRWLTAVYPGIKFPEQLAGRGVERDHFLRGCIGEESAPDDDRICFQTTLFGGIKLPCLFEPMHIAAIDLRKRRVMITLYLPSINGPICTMR